jgi:tRNA A-37 threonylcarbamoyl transferase component Bud32
MTRPTIGRYQLLDQVGAGGFATVYRAYDPTLDREIAVKVLHPHLARDPAVRERFVREGPSLARVRHPNVVQIYDAGQVETTAYLAMEFVPGTPLDEVTRGRPMALGDVIGIVRQIAPALDAIHIAGLIHRDIKPANILIDGRPELRPAGAIGRAVLLDLGIAREMENAGMTATGMLLGTPGYLAPEQIEQPGAVSTRTDVYQLGATVYALLAGRPPFEGDTAQVLYAVAHRAPPELATFRPDLPAHVHLALGRALAKNPAARPARVSEFAALLDGTAPAQPTPGPVAAPVFEPGATLVAPGFDPNATMVAAPPLTAGAQAPPNNAGAGAVQPPYGLGVGPPWDQTTAARPVPAGSAPPPRSGRMGVWPVVAGVVVLGVIVAGGAFYALSGNGDSPPPTQQAVVATTATTATATVRATTVRTSPTLTVTATATTAATRTSTASPTSAASPTSTPSPTAPPSPTAAPVRLSVPTAPGRQVPIPAGLPSPDREVLELLNRNGQAYIAAMRELNEARLEEVFTGTALETYSGFLRNLRAAGRYEESLVASIVVHEFRVDGPDSAFARTQERWMSEQFDRASGRRLGGTDTVYDEQYRFVRVNGRWFVSENTFVVVSQSTY